jgi:hypothetical protein
MEYLALLTSSASFSSSALTIRDIILSHNLGQFNLVCDFFGGCCL